MKIGLITPEYPHKDIQLNVGGIGSFVSNFAKELVKAGHIVFVFLHSQKNENIIIDNGVEIHLIKQYSLKPLTWWFNRKYIQNYINDVVILKKIEILEAPDWTGITAFMKFKCPLVLRLHGSDAFFCNLEGRKQKSKNYFFEKKALLNANGIVGVSNFVANKTKEIFKIKKKIQVIYNAIDTDKFKPESSKVEKNSILYFGSLIRKKGVIELSHIFNKVVEEIPSAKLYLLGKDVFDIKENKSTFELFKNNLSVESLKRIEYVKQVPYEKVKEYMLKMDLVVLPSFAEAFPMTWLEAMSLQKKMVTSNIGWANELMINNVTGFTENPKDHNKYAEKIISLLKNDKKGIEMAVSARKRIIEEFNLNLSIDKNIKFYKSLL